ncbi:helix-turn-helix transcriptional regulator [Gynuella sunshinyii]|uniref:Putative transcriptional regulator n=1 Tax=Gynuella sunshinyii YC6258 TaxID=1445510 RepID=A0A0C5VPC6_9GAMM|nr:YafY family protein [Gynuella sunshinyii]AJQ92114.1 putative transcriptional regulator [Gynuella sunshinyii YC6258]
MSRAERLLELIQILRRHRRPVTAASLAQKLDISVRTVYRDIASLQAQGADIDGEAGIGFILKPGLTLPPLNLGSNEIEALMLGAHWVVNNADPELQSAARNVIAKISAVLPAELRQELESSSLLTGPSRVTDQHHRYLADIRAAIRIEQKVQLQYRDIHDQLSERIIWPFAIGFFEQSRVIIGWCELRQDVRHFRTDRISALTRLNSRYPKSRMSLFKQWRQTYQVPERLFDQ